MPALIDPDSLLVVDVGSISTRAVLFDVVDGRYRFVALGVAPTTAKAPYHNISEGVRLALDRIQIITGRTLVGPDEQLIMPAAADGSGVDRFAATLSAGEALKVVVVGLLDDISLESARRLAATSYSHVVGVFGLNDRRKTEARINLLLSLRPDLVIAAGGTDGGASQSVLKLLEAVGLANYLQPPEKRPEVLFAGNQALKDEIESSLGGVTNLHFSPNLRPTLDVEQMEGAQADLAQLALNIRARQFQGVDELGRWAKGALLPTAAAFGRIIRFQSKAHSTRKGVLGVDVGASAVTVAAAYDGELALNVFPQFGLGSRLLSDLDPARLKAIARWLTLEISEGDLCDYLYNKALYPGQLPATPEEMAIEQALACQSMEASLKLAVHNFPPGARPLAEGLLPAFEPIFATGSVLAQAPNLAQSALLILNGIQPAGITTLVLDQNQIMAALGAAAPVNPTLVVQLLESNSLTHLGTVISPVSAVKAGTPILRLKITYENGQEASLEVRQGSLEMLPLPNGQWANLKLQPLHRCDVGMGAPGRGGGLRVMGGALGLIIDARGRPLQLPEDLARRQEMFKKWLWNLGGQ